MTPPDTHLREVRAEPGLPSARLREALAAAEEELRVLEFAVSHDLRAPLRAIDGFSAVLARDHAGALPPEAAECVTFVREGALELGRKVEAILTLSRLGRTPLEPARVDTAAVARRVAQGLVEQEPPGRSIEVAVGELPACEADERLLEQLLTCLLRNALTFTRPRERARIEVVAEELDGETVVAVRDNGVGFDPQYADRMFDLFQRLHPASEFEGLGAGLAVARRIVRRHGGRIWAESRPGEGATLLFTLP